MNAYQSYTMKISELPITILSKVLLLFIICSMSFSSQGQKNDQSLFRKKRKNVGISNFEFRLRLTDFYIQFAEELEEKADKIYFSSSDPEIKRAALMWKIYGISAMNKAINMPDAIASFYNAWPLTKQMVYFFKDGKGKEVLGTDAQVAEDLSRKYESKLDSIIIKMSNSESHAEQENGVNDWAIAHPIEDFYFARESTMSIFAEWLGEEQLGLGRNVATITEEVVELSNRLNLYVDLAPRQARWQVDYAIMNYLQDSTFEYSLSTMLSSMERITSVVEMTPEIIEFNREATMRDIDNQREKSLRLLIDERKAVIEEIRKERVEIVSVIMEERRTVLEELKNERAIVLEEVRDLYSDVVLQSTSEVERIVDKIFWRLTLISIIIAVTILLAVMLYKKL